MRTLIEELTRDHPAAELFLTGGAAQAVAELLRDRRNQPARHVPHLTLSGIALAAAALPTAAPGGAVP
jgi:hypothetical protein